MVTWNDLMGSDAIFFVSDLEAITVIMVEGLFLVNKVIAVLGEFSAVPWSQISQCRECRECRECHCCDSWSCLDLATQIQVPWFFSMFPFKGISIAVLEYSQFSRHKSASSTPRWEPLAPARHGRDCLRLLQQAMPHASGHHRRGLDRLHRQVPRNSRFKALSQTGAQGLRPVCAYVMLQSQASKKHQTSSILLDDIKFIH